MYGDPSPNVAGNPAGEINRSPLLRLRKTLEVVVESKAPK